MTNDKNSFILYSEYSELISELSNEDAGELFKAIFKYVSTGEASNLNGAAKIVFITIRQALDRNAIKYEEKRQKLKENGKKGGRPKKDSALDKYEDEKFLSENQKVFSESKKSLYVNVNANDNVNENENVSLSYEREEREYRERGERGVNSDGVGVNIESGTDQVANSGAISERDEKILEDYVRRKKLAAKNVTAYVRKIIANGDHLKILEEIGVNRDGGNKDSPPAETREERIKRELSSIHDKKSAAKVLAVYHDALEEYPPELEPIAEQYGLSTSYELEEYVNELRMAKIQAARGP